MSGLGGSGQSRRTLRTPERREVVLRNLRAGLTRTAASAQAGLSHDTLQRWMRGEASMHRGVIEAEGMAEARMITVVLEDAFGRPAQYDDMSRLIRTEKPSNPDSAKWWLARRRPHEFGQRISIDVRATIERYAAEKGMDADRLIAEAERLMSEHAENYRR